MGNEQDDTNVEATVVGRTFISETPLPQIGHFVTYTLDTIPVRVQIQDSGVVVGRVPPADLAIANPNVSRRHCQFEIHGDWAVITDLGSTNGTFVDGTRIDRPTRLRNGMQIALGSFVMKYERRDLKELAQADDLSADIKRAEDYVRALLPQPIESGPVQTQSIFIPSTTLGGDAFGYQYLNEDLFTGFLLDVSGHGIGSAMHAANVANAIRRRALPDVDFSDPAQVASGVNAVFPMEEHNGLMLTLWCFTYNVKTRELRYCAAGHHPSLMSVPGQAHAQQLWLKSPAIGMLPFGKWHVGNTIVPPSARLYVFSDGVFEIVTTQGEQWSMEAFQNLLSAPEQPGLSEPQRLFNEVKKISRPGPLDDDFSVLYLKFT